MRGASLTGVFEKPDGEKRVGAAYQRRSLLVSRLTFTIVIANLIGLVILLLGSFALTQYRDGLIQAKLEGVRAQAQIIADVLGQVAIVESDCVIEEGANAIGDASVVCPLFLSGDDVKAVFNRVWDSFEGRVRIYNVPQRIVDPPYQDASEYLLEDVVLREDAIVVEALPPIQQEGFRAWLKALSEKAADRALRIMSDGFHRDAASQTIEAELNKAVTSSPFAEDRGAASVRLNENGELVASVSIPIRKVQAIYGVVTAEIGGIDDLVARARWSILPFFGLGCLAAILSSLLLTTAIAAPIRQLAYASDKVREGIAGAGRARIPDFSRRRDEIGELSMSLKSMTQAIYDRIEAIERFAADVAHELKNPLTSIRSATETMEIAKAPEAREKLMRVIQKDVVRMDRLITDISNASRLDAELAREAREPVDLRKLLADIVDLYEATGDDARARVEYDRIGAPAYVFANPSALGQVFRNLIDNALSFSGPQASVRVHLVTEEGALYVYVDDDGPGVPADAKEKIFSRFYTKRPQGAAFGDNSGLGLAISRQIVNSHQGRIWVENRGSDEAPRGARFIVALRAAS